jgi:LmbE family N-acetylglucosaminyl deacetylase
MSQVKHFFTSPHLDDAAISCGGLMSKLRAKNELVEVVTFFLKQPNLNEIPPKMRVFADYKVRLEENRRALEFLDVQTRNLDFYELAFIPPFLPYAKVFASPPNGITGFLDLEPIAQAIIEFMNQNPNGRFYFPIGIGNHVDHMRLFFAALKVLEEKKCFDSFFFYEDPYAMMGNMIRQKHIIARQYLHKKNEDISHLSIKAFIGALGFKSVIKNKSIECDMQIVANKYNWIVQTEDIKDYIDKKIQGFFLYPTQVKEFGGENLVNLGMRNYHKFWKNCEPYWKAAKK